MHAHFKKTNPMIESKQDIIKLQQMLIDKDAQLADLKHQLVALTHSLSWRITKPLRWANYQCRLILQKLRGTGARSSAESTDRNDYTAWVARYDTVDNAWRKTIFNRIYLMTHKPCITLIIPVKRSLTMPADLEKTIQSLRQQWYVNWLILLVSDDDDASLLQSYAAEDTRIKTVFISEKSNAFTKTRECINSDWLSIVTPGDILPQHALFWIIEGIAAHPEAGLIYSDEDCMDENGVRQAPYFKPDWNVDLLLTHHYLDHLCVIRTKLIHQLQFSGELSAALRYDLSLHITSLLAPDQIVHIPRVLYHRQIMSKDATRDALQEQEMVQQHLARKGILASVSTGEWGHRVHYQLPDVLPLVSVIIPSRNSFYLLRRCIQSLLDRTDYRAYEIIVMDNGSDEPDALAYLAELVQNPIVRVIKHDAPFNYSALNNKAVEDAQGEVLCLLNNDTEVISTQWLNEMVSLALLPDVGAVGAKLLYPDETIQHGGVILGIGQLSRHSHKHLSRHAPGYQARMAVVSSISAVTAACLVIRKAIYQQVGGLNANELKVAFNDIDFCLRVQDAGYRNVWTPHAELFHHESATRGSDDTVAKQTLFLNEAQYMKTQWGKKLTHDPAYNPNLSSLHEDFSLAWPPRVSWHV